VQLTSILGVIGILMLQHVICLETEQTGICWYLQIHAI